MARYGERPWELRVCLVRALVTECRAGCLLSWGPLPCLPGVWAVASSWAFAAGLSAPGGLRASRSLRSGDPLRGLSLRRLVAPVVCRASQIEPAPREAGRRKEPHEQRQPDRPPDPRPDKRATTKGTDVSVMRIAIQRAG